MKNLPFGLVLLLSQLVGIYALLLSLFPQLGVPVLMDRLNDYPISMLSHFTGSGVALVTGPWLFLSKSRRRAWVHRYTGRLYMLGVLAGGLSSLYLGARADGGTLARSGFISLSILWLWSACKAFVRIRCGRVRAHKSWMVVNFALTFAAVTLRIYLPLSSLMDGEFDVYYGVVAWMCWLPNLCVALWLIRNKQRRLFSDFRKPGCDADSSWQNQNFYLLSKQLNATRSAS